MLVNTTQIGTNTSYVTVSSEFLLENGIETSIISVEAKLLILELENTNP